MPDTPLPPPPAGYQLESDALPPPPAGYSLTDTEPPPKVEDPTRYSFPTALGGPEAYDFGKGVLKGIGSTIMHGGDLIRRGLGMQRVIDRPEVQQDITPANTGEKIGKGVEQAAEFMAPAGIVGKASKAADAAMAGMKYAKPLGIAARAALEGASAGSVAGLQTGGEPKAMGKAALAAGATSAALGAAGAVLPTAKTAARRLYQSALKPGPSMDEAERTAIINTGLREGVVLNANVVDNVQSRIDAINKEIEAGIAQRAQAGATVDPEAVAEYTKRSKQAFDAAHQATPTSDLADIGGVKKEFLEQHSARAPYTKIRPGEFEEAGRFVPEGEGYTSVPQPIPLDEAQSIKRGTYRKLKDSYGEMSTARREALKDIARGLKDKIVEAFPEIAQLNARESALLKLESSLNNFVGREGNKHLIGIGTPLTAAGLHAMNAPVVPLTLLKAALEMPSIKSRLAIALARAQAGPLTQGVRSAIPPLTGYFGAQDADQPPPFQPYPNQPPPLR